MTLLRPCLWLCFIATLFTACTPESESLEPAGQAVEFRKAFPEVIALPDGFQPEGIVAGTGNTFYVGSLADGSIYRGDFRTGTGEVIYTPESGISVGLAFDPRTQYLYVSGNGTGGAFVLDTRSRQVVATFDFGGGFVNDVIVTRDAVYFTDSFTPNLYVAELSPSDQPTGATATLPLSGDFQFQPNAFNANGIEATPNGDALIVVNSSFGELYLVDPATGVAETIDLDGGSVIAGDGILLVGKTLYVVQNAFNQIAEIQLSPNYRSGRITDVITDPDFRVPTTVTRKGSTLYAVNARFGTPPGPDVDYEVVSVSR
ncbi:SMP-30/gluconolactonase/LRE family protein [Neolewinella litorea]|uniref:Superoxide dismutase n=1 Tax=Neolewinella litorea TaxID=2562452 RepID=A0A4S4NL99_9BACT|nr:superoxide dismutase [Neolewinella litorea]THH40676.1 superoxide dismutase [Neolewinella litorea]